MGAEKELEGPCVVLHRSRSERPLKAIRSRRAGLRYTPCSCPTAVDTLYVFVCVCVCCERCSIHRSATFTCYWYVVTCHLVLWQQRCIFDTYMCCRVLLLITRQAKSLESLQCCLPAALPPPQPSLSPMWKCINSNPNCYFLSEPSLTVQQLMY